MKIVILTTLASLAFVGTAAAGEMQGTVKSVDMAKHMITLDDGMSVMTDKDIQLDNVMKGDHVKIMTDDKKTPPTQFTPRFRTDIYPFIYPSKFRGSLEGKVVIITGLYLPSVALSPPFNRSSFPLPFPTDIHAE